MKNYTPRDAKWFRDSKYGLFFHFLPGGNSRQVNHAVDNFDVEAFSEDCARCGAGYVFITLGQNSGYYCSPNSTYDHYTGAKPGEKTTRRDLPADLFDALNKRGMKMMLYFPALAPKEDAKAAAGLGCIDKGKPSWADDNWESDWNVTPAFIKRWSDVIKEYALRYGEKLSGWWFDGCYEWNGFNDEVAEPYMKALKSGNDNSLAAFNPMAQLLKRNSVFEDYTAGEWEDFLSVNLPGENGQIDGIQWHQLSFLGKWWGAGELRYTNAQIIDHIKTVSDLGGVITLDLPLDVNYSGTRIRPDVLAQMEAVKKAIRISEHQKLTKTTLHDCSPHPWPA